MATTPTNNPVPSESPADLKFNAGKIDEFVTSSGHQYVDRKGVAHRTIEGINYEANQAILNYGYITKDSFESGNTLNTANEVLRWQSNGEYYRWGGSFPKVVPAGSTPASTGGIGDGKWVGVGDASLRSDLENPIKGDAIVNSKFGGNVQDAYLSRQRLVENTIDLFIVYGQSNAKGTAKNSPGAPNFVSPNARYWDGTSLAQMTSYMKTSNDGTSTGSAWLSFANKYAGLSGKKAVYINSGKDSQSLAQLQKGDASNNYANMLKYVNSAKSAILSEGSVVGSVSVLFVQGERDEVLSTGKSAYKSALGALWANIKADTGATSFFNYTVGTYSDNAAAARWSVVIQAAQREFCEDTLDAWTVSEDIPKVKAAGMGVDVVHLSQQGYNIVGENSARVVDRILNGDKGLEGDPVTDRRGSMNLSNQQEWQLSGAWINKVSGAWNLDPTLSRGVSLVSSVTDNNADYLTVSIPADLSYILGSGGGSFYTTNSSDVRVMFDKMVYQDRTTDGQTLAKMYFIADVQVLVDMTPQTIRTNLKTDLDLSTVITASGWSTGVVTLTHPSNKAIPFVQGTLAGVFLYSIPVISPTETQIQCVNAANEARNSKFVVNLPGMVIPPRAFPNGTEVFFNLIGAKKTVI